MLNIHAEAQTLPTIEDLIREEESFINEKETEENVNEEI